MPSKGVFPNMEKALIMHSGGIGDLLLALPAMRSFRAVFRRATAELMGQPERLSLIRFDLKAQSIHAIDRAGMAYLYLKDAALPDGLGSFFAEFKAILVFGKSSLDLLSKNLKKAGAGRVIPVPSFPTRDAAVHVADALLQTLREENITGEPLDRPLALPEEAEVGAQEFFARNGIGGNEKFLAIHPGSGSRKKNWAIKHFLSLAEWAKQRSQILLILGPAEKEVKEIGEAFKRFQPIVADQLPLLQLAGILKKSSAYLGNDSGITHLAGALGVATVALFGPTDPAIWGPRGPKVKIIHDPEGLDRIDPDRVIESLSSFLIPEAPKNRFQETQGR